MNKEEVKGAKKQLVRWKGLAEAQKSKTKWWRKEVKETGRVTKLEKMKWD